MRTFSLYKISSEKEPGFDPGAYSRFKFGEGNEGEVFGLALAKAFIAAHKNDLLGEREIVLLPSPYDSIPTASFTLAQILKREINRFLQKNGKKSLLESKIHRYKTYSVDYGNLDFEQRLSLISGDTYHLDKNFLQGRLVLLVDDIRITGSHELMIANLLLDQKVEGDFIFMYLAELVNKDIAPNYENYLNYYAVKDMRDLLKLVLADSFIFNTRVIKYVLKSEEAQLDAFIASAPESKLITLCDLAIGNNYHLMPEYRDNLQRIQQHLHYGYQSSKRTTGEPERS